MTNTWSNDVATGRSTALLAWRRTDVADLNRLARDRWDQLGHLVGDDVTIDGRPYAIGDRIVALAPNPGAGIVTSEQLGVVAIAENRIDARTEDDRIVVLTGEHTDRQHMDYAYALTVHRSQGSTYDRAHVLAAGGGRELAYVALSRAREHTVIHATADDLAQAVDDLHADWGVEHHQRWIADTPATAGREPEPAARPASPAIEPAAMSIDAHFAAGQRRLRILERDYHDLHAGIGRWEHTIEGAAARRVHDTRLQLDHARRIAIAPTSRRRDRRTAERTVPALAAAVADAERHWQVVGQPAVDELRSDINAARRQIDTLESRELIQRLDQLRHDAPIRSTSRDLGLSM